MGLFSKKIEEVKFIKSYKEDINILNLEEMLDGNKNKALELELKKLKEQSNSEKKVYNELQNTFLDLNVFHKIRLTNNSQEVNMDYLIISNNFICPIICIDVKDNFDINEFGDILVNKKSICNPFSLNDRNVNYLNNILLTNKLAKELVFNPLVILTNEESVVNHNTSPEYLKVQLIKVNQISMHLKQLFIQDNDKIFSDKNIEEINDFILNNNNVLINEYDLIEEKSNFDKTIDKTKEEFNSTFKQFKKLSSDIASSTKKVTSEIASNTKKVTSDIATNTKRFTNEKILTKSNKRKLEALKFAIVFKTNEIKDSELLEIIKQKPKDLQQLIKTNVLDENKIKKYGDDILNYIHDLNDKDENLKKSLIKYCSKNEINIENVIDTIVEVKPISKEELNEIGVNSNEEEIISIIEKYI